MKCMFTAATTGLAQEIPIEVSDLGRDFLTECLTVNPKDRPSAIDLLSVPFSIFIYVSMDGQTVNFWAKVSHRSSRVYLSKGWSVPSLYNYCYIF